MFKRCVSMLGALLLLAGAVPTAWGALALNGEPINPHGYPEYYQDGNGVALEPCLTPPAGNATRQDLCIFDPPDQANPDSVALGVGAESLWWLAEANISNALGAGLNADLILALEGTFAAEEPKAGDQIAFGRVRIRIDVPTPGQYTITHPYGQEVFVVGQLAGGREINYTADIGSINIVDPTQAFAGALQSDIGPFLTWPDYASDPSLQVQQLDQAGQPTGVVLEQYVGDPNIPHVVTGSPTGNNLFRIQGPGGIDVQTDLFSVMGKVHDPTATRTAYLYPAVPPQKLFAVGPVNRAGVVGAPTPQQPDGVRTGTDYPGYPMGFPLWYQENLATDGTLLDGGLKLTLCPAADPMCISAPVDPNVPASVALRTGEEAFWWSAEAFVRDGLGAGLDALLVLALEGAFGGDESVADGNQIGFGRLRLRIDVPTPGQYTITHPYGQEVFDVAQLAGGREINFTRDIMMNNPAEPDNSFIGALYSDIGPRLLTWDTFNADPAQNDSLLLRPHDPNDPRSPLVQYVGDPAVEHKVSGSPTGNNLFRIQGPGGIDVQTDLFTVSGKLFDPATFETVANPAAPLAIADEATTAQETPVNVAILANDTSGGAPVNPAATTVTVLTGPARGALAINADKSVGYTPDAGFAGTDTFTYQITVNGLVSNLATATITVTPVEAVTVKTARLELRRLRYDIEGTGTLDGSTLTIYPGTAAGATPIGTAVVIGGRWRFRATGTTSPNTTSITIVSDSGMSMTAPLQVR